MPLGPKNQNIKKQRQYCNKFSKNLIIVHIKKSFRMDIEAVVHIYNGILLSHEKECIWVSLATWCEDLTHWKRPWCWERLKAGGEGHNKGWDGWMASLTQWTWVWVNSGGWQWTGRPGVLQPMGSQRVGHDWATELNEVDEPRAYYTEWSKSERER